MTAGCEWRHSPEACAEDLGDLKKVSELSSYLGRRRLTFAYSPRPCGGCRARWEADGKVSIERLCLSLPYVEKPFNSKVIKSFVAELRSRQVFFVFRDSYVIYICALWTLWTFCVPVWICLFISGYVPVTTLWSTAPLPFAQQIFLIASVTLWQSSNL